MSGDRISDVRRAARAVAQADAAAALRRERLAELVRVALAEQVSVAALVLATGLTRGRIYQIRDGRR